MTSAVARWKRVVVPVVRYGDRPGWELRDATGLVALCYTLPRAQAEAIVYMAVPMRGNRVSASFGSLDDALAWCVEETAAP